MYVVATAGHVDHGKSTLVKALTGQEPDRWDEEKRRGLTIDLGFVWTTLPSGRDLAFVDVPGHEKFLGNMLAGVGPAPAVMFIVAADEGWQEQSDDHRDAVDAFGITNVVIAMTRADRADEEQREQTRARIAREVAGTTLENAPVIEVSAHSGEGLDDLRRALDTLLELAPTPDPDARLRLWLDRSFSIRGAGTVVTGTLGAGTVSVGDTLDLSGVSVQVRGLQSEEKQATSMTPAARVAVNLRGRSADQIARGEVLVTPGAWIITDTLDVAGSGFDNPPREVVVHIGTAAVEAAFRRLGDRHARLTLTRALPLQVGDRLVLRKPGERSVYSGVQVLDVDPPELGRRGAGARRATELAGMNPAGDAAHEVTRRGAMRRADIVRLGIDVPADPPKGIVAFRDFWVHAVTLLRWRDVLANALDEHVGAEPLSPGLSRGAALTALNLPDENLLGLVVAAAKLEQGDGVLRRPGRPVDLGDAERGVATLEKRLRVVPFAAPEADDLTELGLGTRELAAAERAGRLLRLGDGVVLLPDAPRIALARLRGLDQPFTTSAARQVLDTTRRVAIPLLEHLDTAGLTRRIDGSLREVR